MERSSSEELRAQALVWGYSVSMVDTMVLKCAIEFGIIDIIEGHGQPMTLFKLGASLRVPSTNIDVLRRLMNYLVHLQILTVESREGEEYYGATSASKFLSKDHEKSMISGLRIQFAPHILEAWLGLGSCLQGKASMSAFEMVHQESLWKFASKHPEHSDLFNREMACHARLVTPVLIDDCGDMFREIGSLVDVGGGTGTAIRAISEAFPHIRCTLFDLPHVVENSRSLPGVDRVAGDMFSSIPNADAILLMWILHDWDDVDCIRILKNSKAAISKERGKVIIVDIVTDIEESEELSKLVHARYAFDIVMMATTGGKERTKKEWKTLLSTAGFSHCKITPLKALESVIEALP